MSGLCGRAPDVNGRAHEVAIAVNSESGIQDLRDLLVFCGLSGHSFATGIVILAA